MGDITDRDKTIALQRKKIEEQAKLISALKQEIALLNEDISKLKKRKK